MGFSQNATLYVVDVTDTDFSNIKKYTYTKQTLNTNFSTIVDVRNGNYSIGRIANWQDKELTKSELEKMVSSVLGMNNLKYDEILGLRWGMKLEQAVSELREIGLKYWSNIDNGIICMHKTAWNEVTYDGVRLCYFTSQKQNKFLYETGFIKFCNNLMDAQALQKNIATTLKLEYGSESFEENIEENGFKSYMIYGPTRGGSISRINLYINEIDKSHYAIILIYNGILAASEAVERDNQRM